MMKIVAFVTLLATSLALPLEDDNIRNPEAQPTVQPLQQSDQLNLLQGPQEGTVLQQDGPLPSAPTQEGSPDEDLKTDPTFWFGYRGYGGYPIRRRSYHRSYYPSYYHYKPRSYYAPQTYYWGAPSYYW